MKIVVNRIYGKDVAKLRKAGWKVTNTLTSKTLRLADYRRNCGYEMVKSFQSMGDAIRGFECVTGYDAIADVDASGCSVYTFRCLAENIWCSGWGCGQYLYARWLPTPRACLEALNK